MNYRICSVLDILKVFGILFLCLGSNISLLSQLSSDSHPMLTFLDKPVYENGVLELNWKLDKTESISYFLVYRKAQNENEFIEIGNILGQKEAINYNFQDKSIIEPSIYKYKVLAILSNGQKSIPATTEYKINNVSLVNEEIIKYLYGESDDLNMRLISNFESDMYGGFYNNKGEEIQKVDSYKVFKGLNEYKFNTKHFEPGDYLLILKIGKENIIEKVIIQG